MAPGPVGPCCPPRGPSRKGRRRDPPVHPSCAHGSPRGCFRGPPPSLFLSAPSVGLPAAPATGHPVPC
eukprot:1878544-Alexandrium_andersonii.AAC.1